MNSAKIIAIITGAISILIAFAYLILVQILDFRSEMIPAPLEVIFPRWSKSGLKMFQPRKKAIFERINPLVVTVIGREHRFAQSADD